MKNKEKLVKLNKEALIKLGSKTAKAGFSNEDDIVIKFNNWQQDTDGGGYSKYYCTNEKCVHNKKHL